jgi:hypothetical protein
MNALNAKALVSLVVLLVIMAALIFIPAGTLEFWQAWVFLAVYFGSSFAITLYLMKNDPKLLQRRMRRIDLAIARGRTISCRESTRLLRVSKKGPEALATDRVVDMDQFWRCCDRGPGAASTLR